MFGNDRLTRQVQFIIELEKLKAVTRQNKTLDGGRPENSAEHSWHLATMAMVLGEDAPDPNTDMDKVIKMLLIHDLVEIYAGDAFLYSEEQRKLAVEKESLAAQRLFALLPECQEFEFHALRNEFEERKTPESIFAAAIDALQPLINHCVTAPENFNPHELASSKIRAMKKSVGDTVPRFSEVVEYFIEKSTERGLYKRN